MRYAILSDVHGNLAALRAAIAALRAEGVDQWWCAGDVIGYGPHPNECVETIAELGARSVLGNHELMVLGELTDQRCGRTARESTRWTRSELRDDCRAYLSRLPQVLTQDDLVMTHASLEGPEPYVHAEQVPGQLRRLQVDHPGARVLVLGHTHKQMVSAAAGPTSPTAGEVVSLGGAGAVLLNPGAVGQSRYREPAPRVRFMLLDTERDEVRAFAVPYDHAACRTALREKGLPTDLMHRRGGVIRKVRHRARAALRTLTQPPART